MKYIILIVFFVLGASELRADYYMDIGVGVHGGEFDSFSHYNKKTRTVHEISPFVGFFEWGYEENGKSIFFRHSSDTDKTDTGLNMIGVKLRLF